MTIDFQALAKSHIRNLIPYQPGKPVEELERELGITSSIKLASNENPLGASPKAITAAQQALANAHIYPDGSYFELRTALAHFISVSPEQIIVGNGSENILELIIKSYVNKDDEAIISQYAFLTIPLLLQSYGAMIQAVPAKNWGHDTTAMLQQINKKTRIIFLVNPNNPTGTYINEDAFSHFLKSIPPHVLVVVDEAYSEYITNSDYPHVITYLQQYPNLIITRTFSKVYGLAALRIGYSISSPKIADILNRARLPFNVNTIAAKAACAAIEDFDHVKESVHLNQQGMLQLEEGFKKIALSYIPSVGNFIAVNVGNGESIYQKLLQEGVIVRPLKAYHLPEFIRVTIGTAEQNERFLTALGKVR